MSKKYKADPTVINMTPLSQRSLLCLCKKCNLSLTLTYDDLDTFRQHTSTSHPDVRCLEKGVYLEANTQCLGVGVYVMGPK